jgi:hypothetical protein
VVPGLVIGFANRIFTWVDTGSIAGIAALGGNVGFDIIRQMTPSNSNWSRRLAPRLSCER